MEYKTRTGCPFSYSMGTFGDKWTLLILREIIVMRKTYYDEFIQMEEGISTNILGDRLKEMISRNLLTRRKDPENKRRWIYEPTEKALDLLPMMVELILWSSKYDPETGVTCDHVENFTKKRARSIKGMRAPFE